VTSMLARAVLICAGLTAPAAAAPAPAGKLLPRVVLAVDGIGQPRNLPVLLAERLGYFRSEGVTVVLVDAPATPSPAELIADGRADGAVAYFHHTFMSQTGQGPETTSVALLAITPDERLLVASRLRDRVRNVRDLKGMKIITGGENSGKTTAATWALLHAGLSARDYIRLPLSPKEEIAKALANGEADAVMAHEPDASFYEKSGAAFQVADLITPGGTRAALGTVYPATALYFARTYIADHPCEVQHVTRAVMKALRFIETHDAAAVVAELPVKTGGPDRADFTRQIAADRQMFGGDGTMDSAAAAGELRAMAAINPTYTRVRLTLTYTNGFVAGSKIPARCR